MDLARSIEGDYCDAKPLYEPWLSGKPIPQLGMIDSLLLKLVHFVCAKVLTEGILQEGTMREDMTWPGVATRTPLNEVAHLWLLTKRELNKR